MRRRVVITGMGIVAPTGVGIEPLWNALVEGRSYVTRITRFDASTYPSQIAAQCDWFDPLAYLSSTRARRLGRFCQMAVATAKLAMGDAGIAHAKGGLGPETGIFIGTACGASHIIEEQLAILRDKGYRRLHPMVAPMASPQVAASQVAAELEACGPILTVSSDCPAGIDAIGWAMREIASGNLERAIAGGVDTPVTPLLLIAFNRAGALSVRNDQPACASRPFDQARDGFVLAEGGALFVLESLEAARARGAKVYGELLGLGWGTDPSSEFGRAIEPAGFEAAMRHGLLSADLTPADIDLVCAHAPGIPATDVAEACAIESLFGTAVAGVSVTSIKGCVGQPLAAGPGLQLATALTAIATEVVPPTVNCDDPDPRCALNIVRGEPTPRHIRVAMVNAHGFGGNNTSMIVGAPPD
jgi:3-oxoacyl-[acyl-carrier-protein] synthase II